MKKIMIVEDDQDNRELLVECLELENYNVIAFENGQKALANLELKIPDILLMDLCFPLNSAEDFVREFRLKTGQGIPIIVLSAKPDIKKVAAKIKAFSYLPKPYDLYLLYSEVDSALNLSRGGKNRLGRLGHVISHHCHDE